MAGKILTIDHRGCRGWARLSEDPHYAVMVHLIIDSVIHDSTLANLACDNDEAGEEAHGACFTLDIPDDALKQPDAVSVLIGESNELLQPPTKRHIDEPNGIDAPGGVTSRATVATYKDGLVRGLAAADIINLFYLDILHRPADRSGLGANLAAFENGRLTLDGIRMNLLASPEYKAIRRTKADPPGRIFNYPLAARSSTQRCRFERHVVAFQRSTAPMAERLVRFFPGLLVRPNLLERVEEAAARGLPAREVFCRALAQLSDQPGLILPDLPQAVLPADAGSPADDSLEFEVPLTSAVFALGWHRVEDGGCGSFRWMRQIGVMLNPCPHRAVARIDFEINGWYGGISRAVAAASEMGRLALTRHEPAAGSCRLSVTGGEAGDKMDYVVLIAGDATSPSRYDGTPDARVVSFNIARVVIAYKEET